MQLFLFSQTQGVSTFQLTFIRGIICACLVVLMLLVKGESIRGRLVAPVDRQNVKPLFLRAFQSALCVYIAFMSIKYFNVSTVGIVCSLKPIITCVIAVALMGEKMGISDVISNALGLLAIMLVIVGTPAAEGSADATSGGSWAFIALISQPLLLAGGDVLIKKMKKLPEEPVSFAQGIALMIFAGTCMIATGESFKFVFELSW